MEPECKHDWKEEYYGIRCTKCDLFYPDNCNWFAPVDDEDSTYTQEFDEFSDADPGL